MSAAESDVGEAASAIGTAEVGAAVWGAASRWTPAEGAAPSACPHAPQNLARGGFSKSQRGQRPASGAPHSVQNAMPA